MNSTPQNNANRSQNGPASVPFNPPAASGIPMNVPRNAPSPPATPGAQGQPLMGMPGNGTPPPPAAYAPQLNGAMPPSAPAYAPPLNGGMSAPMPPNAPAPYGAAPGQSASYAPPPGAYGTSPGMQQPYPPQMPGSYQVPQTPYAPQQNAEYRPMSSSPVSDGPAIGMGLLAGILLALACGLGFGFASIAIGFRIPYLSLGIGYLIGYAVLYASKENGDVQGIIGGACSLAACLLGLGIMYMNGIFISPFAFIIVAFAVYRGYAIPAGG